MTPLTTIESAHLLRRRGELYEQLEILLGRLATARGSQLSSYSDSIHTTRGQIAFVEARLAAVREP